MPHAHFDGQMTPIGGRKFAPLDHRKQALRLRSPASVLNVLSDHATPPATHRGIAALKIAIQRSVFDRYDRELL